jgi:hypothetical protein
VSVGFSELNQECSSSHMVYDNLSSEFTSFDLMLFNSAGNYRVCRLNLCAIDSELISICRLSEPNESYHFKVSHWSSLCPYQPDFQSERCNYRLRHNCVRGYTYRIKSCVLLTNPKEWIDEVWRIRSYAGVKFIHRFRSEYKAL